MALLEGFDSYTNAFAALDANTVDSIRESTLSSGLTSTLQKQINDQDNKNLLQSVNTAEGSSNNLLTFGAVASRNTSLQYIAEDMIKQNNKAIDGTKDTYTRQGEINEWQAQNKLDTLFFLQLTFLFFTLMVIMIFLRQYGFMTTGMIWLLGGFFLLILIGTLWNRLSYTMYSRDGRYWNRRYVGLTDSGLSATAATCQ
jgi:hypothetical protein